MDPFGLAVLLATVNKALLDFVVAVIRCKWPGADLWWFDLVSLVTGAALGWFAQVNVLTGVVADPTVGRIVTCLMVGAGANVLNEVLGSTPLQSASVRYVGPSAQQGQFGRPRRGW